MDRYLKDWVFSLNDGIASFLQEMKIPEKPGFYKYSMSGDIFTSRAKWGLGNSVFAAKILYMLNRLTDEDRKNISDFIRTFQDENGQMYDPIVQRLSRFDRWSRPLVSLDFGNITNARTRCAETRQAFAALMCLDRKPDIPYAYIPNTVSDVKYYIRSLDWTRPWAAASHVSHLVFFLDTNDVFFGVQKNSRKELEECIFRTAEEYRQSDGAWYDSRSSVPLNQKVNAAMKMITAYVASKRNDFGREKNLIDLCLKAINDNDACDNLNIILVLYYCHKNLDYRTDEIRSFCENKLKVYKRHYWPQHGGFSFYERKANDVYYGAKISKGLNEPDIHGTIMFLWGITMISDILGISRDTGLRVPVI